MGQQVPAFFEQLFCDKALFQFCSVDELNWQNTPLSQKLQFSIQNQLEIDSILGPKSQYYENCILSISVLINTPKKVESTPKAGVTVINPSDPKSAYLKTIALSIRENKRASGNHLSKCMRFILLKFSLVVNEGYPTIKLSGLAR